MKRILVIGSGGAGKSTLSRQLGDILGLEVIHLDRHFWKPGWIESEREEWDCKLNNLLKREAWIMDGNYARTLPERLVYADTVIFLDFPRRICYWRIFRRILKSYGRTRVDMAEGCNEHFDWSFVVWLWEFPKKTRPDIYLKLQSQRNVRKIILRSREEVRLFLRSLSSQAMNLTA